MFDNNIVNLSNNTSEGPIPNVSSLSDVLQKQANDYAQAQTVHTSTTAAGGVNLTVGTETTTFIPVDNMEVSVNTVLESNTKAVEEKEEAKFIMNDKFVVNTELFKTMIQNAKKAATCSMTSPITQMFDITFDTDYLKVVATDESNVLVQVNTNVGFKDTLHFNVAADFFTNLVTKLDCDTIEFVLDSETRYIKIITDDGSELKVPETYDRNTGSSFTIERESGKIQPNDIVIDIDGCQFKSLIQSASSLSASPDIFNYLSGIYCSERIYSTDVESMFGLPNLPQLEGYSFYLSNKFVKLFMSLNFDTKSQIVLRSDGNNITHVIIKDSKMEIEGPCDLENTGKYPIDTIRTFTKESFVSKFTIDKAKLENVLKIAELFIVPNTDKESCIFIPDVNTGLLHINSVNKQARQSIPINGLSTPIKPFNIRVKNCLGILNNCQSDTLTIEIDSENYRNIRIVDNNFILLTSIVNLED